MLDFVSLHPSTYFVGGFLAEILASLPPEMAVAIVDRGRSLGMNLRSSIIGLTEAVNETYWADQQTIPIAITQALRKLLTYCEEHSQAQTTFVHLKTPDLDKKAYSWADVIPDRNLAQLRQFAGYTPPRHR